jgi:hypothetical protein
MWSMAAMARLTAVKRRGRRLDLHQAAATGGAPRCAQITVQEDIA